MPVVHNPAVEGRERGWACNGLACRHVACPLALGPAGDGARPDEVVTERAEEGGLSLEAVVEREDAQMGVQDLERGAFDRHALRGGGGPIA